MKYSFICGIICNLTAAGGSASVAWLPGGAQLRVGRHRDFIISTLGQESGSFGRLDNFIIFSEMRHTNDEKLIRIAVIHRYFSFCSKFSGKNESIENPLNLYEYHIRGI